MRKCSKQKGKRQKYNEEGKTQRSRKKPKCALKFNLLARRCNGLLFPFLSRVEFLNSSRSFFLLRVRVCFSFPHRIPFQQVHLLSVRLQKKMFKNAPHAGGGQWASREPRKKRKKGHAVSQTETNGRHLGIRHIHTPSESGGPADNRMRHARCARSLASWSPLLSLSLLPPNAKAIPLLGRRGPSSPRYPPTWGTTWTGTLPSPSNVTQGCGVG